MCARVCVAGDFRGTGAGLSTFRRVAKGPRGLSVVLIHSFIHWARERVVHQRRSLVLSQVLFFRHAICKRTNNVPPFPKHAALLFPSRKEHKKNSLKECEMKHKRESEAERRSV